MRLAVRQSGELAGWLESGADRGVVFRYDGDYLRLPGAVALSLSLPLRDSPYSQAQALPFFAGLLPDGELRRRVAEYLHVSESSPLRLLEALGGECAGTVSLVREDGPDGAGDRAVAEGYAELPLEELASMIREAERRPLLAPRGGARLSLAGAQEKLPLLRREGRWYLPLGGAPSSHIIKPEAPAFPGIVADEFACMRLAASLGLPVPPVELAALGLPVLVVERYDRVGSPGGGIARLRQEDFCQALGLMPDRKYQSDGGPGFADLGRLVRRACAQPIHDLELLVDIALFNVLAGNCDAHGKNFSLLHRAGGIGLAPFYDLVSTTVWPELDTRLSMRFGGEYRLERLRPADIDAFAAELGLRAGTVRSRAASLVAAAPRAWEAVLALPELRADAELLEVLRSGWEARSRQLAG